MKRKPITGPRSSVCLRKKPEVVFFTSYGTESKLILKQAYEMGLKPSKGWYADYPTMWSNEVIPETAEGILGLKIGKAGGAPFRGIPGSVPEKIWQSG